MGRRMIMLTFAILYYMCCFNELLRATATTTGVNGSSFIQNPDLIPVSVPDIKTDVVKTRFEYYGKENPSVPISSNDIKKENPPKKVFFYVHGWNTENLDVAEARRIKDAIFETQKDVGMVILVDWTEASSTNTLEYFTKVAPKVVPAVAQNLENEVKRLYNDYGISTENMEMTGHSAGAHIIGQAGKLWNAENIGPPIAKMTVLDPAGPGGYKDDPKLRIAKGDATFVEGIHTSNVLGIWEDIGDEDIYPYEHDVIANCENLMMARQCLHGKAVRELYIQKLHGKQLVDPDDPKRGKERHLIPRSPRKSVSVLILDVSPSMKDYNRIGSLVTSSKRHIKQVPIGSYVGIVIFGGHAQVSQSPVNISDDATRNSVLSKVPTTSTQIWGTSIGAGLRAAIGTTHSFTNEGSCPNFLLITDGDENTRPFRNEVQIPKCTRVNSIGLGGQADKGLEELSDQTNGQVASVSDKDSLDRLTQALHDSNYALMDPNQRPITLPTKHLDLGGGTPTHFNIDKGIGKNTQFFISTPQYKTVRPELTAPDGTVLGSSDYTVDQDLEGVIFKIPLASPGNWSLKVKSDQIQRKKRETPLSANVFVTTMQTNDNEVPIRMEGQLSSNILTYSVDAPSNLTKILARVRRGDDMILGAFVEAILVSPEGSLTSLILLDNGVGADDEKNDGVYSKYISESLSMGGRYDVTVRAKNGANTKIRPLNTISFIPLDSHKIGQFEDVYPFERQVGLGSVKAVNEYIQPLPIQVQDLHVGNLDAINRHCQLFWTAAGNIADSGKAEGIELRVSTNHSAILSTAPNNHTLLLNGSDVVQESLEPKFAGDLQNVTVQIPEEIWVHAKGGIDLYFVVRTMNNESNFSQLSNIASASYALYNDDETNVENTSGDPVLVVVLSLVGGVILVGFALFVKFRRQIYSRVRHC